jgi:hypothetical protein
MQRNYKLKTNGNDNWGGQEALAGGDYAGQKLKSRGHHLLYSNSLREDTTEWLLPLSSTSFWSAVCQVRPISFL